jgi:hypothetical protein
MQPHKLLKLSRPLVLLTVLSACLLALAPAASAAGCENEFTDGDANGSWIDAANWEHGVPGETETVCIPSGIAQVNIPLAAQAKAKSIVAQSPLTITSTATLTIKESSNAVSNELTSVDLEGTIHTEGSSLKLSGSNVVHSGGQITAAGTPVVTLVSGGTLGGAGTIAPSFVAQSGSSVQPGGSEAVGTLTFGSAYTQSEGARLDLDLASDSSFDQIHAGPTNSFVFGTVTVHLLGGYVPTVGTGWEFVSGTTGVLNGVTGITPSQFSVHSVPGGDELRLDSALPSGGEEPGDGEQPAGGEQPNSGGSGGGGDAGSSQTGGNGQGPATNLPGPGNTSVPVQCVVPKVAGLRLAQAKKALTKAHCAPGKVKLRAGAKGAKGRVIGASKKPKTKLPAGSKVNLTVSGKTKKA